MTSAPAVSVIMPAYNAAETIGESIASVIAQTFGDWELIITDDGSRDETPQIAQTAALKDSRLRFFANESNQGTAEARNRGIKQARGEWLAFLDSDDLWREDKLEKQLQFAKETNASISYTSTAYIYEGVRSEFVLRAKQKLFYKDLLKHNLMSCSSVMVRREAMPLFAKGSLHEDYAAWLQILRKVGCAYGLDEPLLTYRRSTSTKSGRPVYSGIMTCRAYRYMGYTSITAFLLTLRYSLHSIQKRLLERGTRKGESA